MSYRKDYCGSQVKTWVLVEVSNRKYGDKMPPESWRPVHFPSRTERLEILSLLESIFSFSQLFGYCKHESFPLKKPFRKDYKIKPKK